MTESKASRYGWGFLSFVMLLALWLSNTAQVYLYNLSPQALEALSESRGLVPSSGMTSIYHLLGRLPVDPIWASSTASTLLMLAGFALLWAVGKSIWQNSVSPSLCCGLLFFGSHTLWLSSNSTEVCAAILLKAAAVACIISAKVPLLCGVVLALAPLDPNSSVSLYLVLSFLAFKRQKAYGPIVCLMSVVGGGAVLAFMLHNFLLRPSSINLSWWAFIPLFSVFAIKELREARLGLYLTMLIASYLGGSCEFASAICLGDLALTLLKDRPDTLPATEEAHWNFNLRKLKVASLLLVLVLAILPGEQYLNRKILIPAQKQKIPIAGLFAPFSLQKHIANLDQDQWRSKTPFPGMTAADTKLLRSTKGPFRVLSVGQQAEDRRLSLAYALATDKELLGWASPKSLSASSLVCRALAKNVVLGEEQILFRFPGTDRQPTLEKGPSELPEDLPELDFRSLTNLPFRRQEVSNAKGSAYILAGLNSKETLFFEDDPAFVIFSSAPEVYTLQSPRDEKQQRELKVNQIRLRLESLATESTLPSRSLIDIPFKLSNVGETPISSQELGSVVLKTKKGQSFTDFAQEFSKDFILYPGEGLRLSLYLATPEPEGKYEMTASVTTVEGQQISLEFGGQTEIKTWRRLPPVGTWVEK